MASSEQAEIASALSGGLGSPYIEMEVTETVPLKKNSFLIQTNSWLRRLRNSVLIKSKAANMILFWTFVMYFVHGIALDPNNTFSVLIAVRVPLEISSSKNTFSGGIVYVYVIGSGVYGIIAVWLLFYSLAGYLADVRYGRYKVVLCSLRLMWFSLIIFISVSAVISAVFWPIYMTKSSFINITPLICYLVIMGVIVLLTLLMIAIAFAGFAANVIQFGIDQLQDLPSRDTFLFIYWYLLLQYFGISIGKLVWSAAYPTKFSSVSFLLIGLLLLVVIIPITLCIAQSRWFIKDAGLGTTCQHFEE